LNYQISIDLDILQGRFLVFYFNSLKPSFFNHHFFNLNCFLLWTAGQKAPQKKYYIKRTHQIRYKNLKLSRKRGGEKPPNNYLSVYKEITKG
jgi:hypothetical protein